MIQNLKSIHVAVTKEFGPDETSCAVAYGLSLARQAGAHLTVQAAAHRLRLTSSWVSQYASDAVGAENVRLRQLVDDIINKARVDADAARVEATTYAHQLSYPDLISQIMALARLNDLSIIDAEREPIHPDRDLLRSLLLGSGCPLVVVPAEWTEARVRHILVAWDGSAPAARAVHDALPFLRVAEAVHIVAVTGEKDLPREPGEADLVVHLARHGVAAEASTLQARQGDVAETLREAVADLSAEMIVMGGYVRSPLRELIFGGVTQSLLAQSPVPLLMSH